VRKYLANRAHIAFVVAAIMAIIVVTGCSGGGQALTAKVTGTVLHDGNHRALADLQVTDNRVGTTTGADGTFALELGHSGATTLYVVADGYEVEQRAVPAGAGVKDIGTFYMKPVTLPGYGNIVGIVADAGRLAEGAQVWVGGNTAVTDATGAYTLYNVPMGQRTVTASTGSKSGTASVMVISLREVTADIALTSGPPLGPLSD